MIYTHSLNKSSIDPTLLQPKSRKRERKRESDRLRIKNNRYICAGNNNSKKYKVALWLIIQY